MATRINTEFNYRYIVEGETIWYKIKTIKGFINTLNTYLKNINVHALKLKAKKAKLEFDTSLTEWEKLELEAEILEIENNKDTEAEVYRLTLKEKEVLERLLNEYYEIANQERLEGYDDDDMLEATAQNEFLAKLVKSMKASVIATGAIPPELIERALKAPPETILALQQQNLLPQGDLKCLR